jgi:anti-sigma B factor antagonist
MGSGGRPALGPSSRPRSRPLSHLFPLLSVEPEVTGSRTVLRVAGEVDLATAPQLRAAIDAAVTSGAPEVCVDLCATTFMDSSGLHVLVEARRRAEETGCDLTLACAPGPVARVIELSGVGELIPRTS